MLDRLDPPAELSRGEALLALLDGQAITPRTLDTLRVEVVRELTPEDLLGADDGQVVAAPTTLGAIRSAHHRIAQLLVEGAATTRVSLITGYSPGYILRLQGDPMFKELLAYYASQAEQHTADVRERLSLLGLNALDELQQRLEEKPQEFTKRDLLDIIKQAAPTGGSGGPPAPPSGPAVALQVQFVTAPPASAPAPVLDVKATRLPPEQEI